MGQGHRVTFNMNTSFTEITKAYTSYMKIKEEKGSLTKEGEASRYLEQYYQVWDEYFWMTPEEGQLIAPATICRGKKEQKVGFGERTNLGSTYHPNQSAQWPSSDWKYYPGIRWVAPSGTQWLCGLNLWP